MPEFKRMILLGVTTMMCVSGTFAIKTEANTETIQNIQQELNQTAKEKKSINDEIAKIQQEMDSLNNYIAENKTKMDNTQKRIDELNQLIEKNKEEIVILEDKIHNRKEVMKNRLKALQNDDNNFNLVIKVLIESKSLDDFIQRASAVNALLDADNDILEAQKQDLKRIEEHKKEIDKQQQILNEEQQTLAKQQEELNNNLQSRQENLSVMQDKYSQIAEQEAGIAAQLKAAQDKIRAEQAAAAAIASVNQGGQQTAPTGNGREMYVSATAYSPEESGPTTRLGHNIHENPNLKIIAVDPTVIPLGSRVWVEGYGEAIAGDTGSAIKGYKIDVLMPTKAAALQWGRKTVKVIVLN
ncbi:3D domain-containing protein [Bacillus marasmi]|uniref:3D domain-containing protein n=1 Tax=Bacillus marasmi TaxID=1926279 RepID=UPI0011C92986|nr:3D domain-containing protein [Bacillus marasmi]